METRSSEQQLSAPLWRPAPPGTDDGENNAGDDAVDGAFDDGRYDALGSTKARKLSGETLLNAIGETSSTRATSVATLDDEADVAAGSSAGSKLTSPHPQPRLTTFVLSMILFFNAGGGPFGVEPSLKAAGNLYGIIGFVAMPFLWALPEAVITYELSSMYPCASGGVRWTEEAFGEGCGLLVGFLGWVAGVSDNATSPVLFLSYVHNHYFPHISETDIPLIRFGILSGITMTLAFVNYRGLDVVGKASSLIFVVCMAPFVLMVIIGIPKVDPQKWLQTPSGEVEVFDDDSLTQNGWFPDEVLTGMTGIYFTPFINNLYFKFKGFDQGGHYSTTVSKRTLRNGIGTSFIVVTLTYLLPILISTGATDLEQDQWKAGSFATAGSEIGGRWLGSWIVVASGVSLLAQFISGMAADSLQLLGMADRGQLPGLCSYRSPYGTPTCGLLFSVAVIMALLPLPFLVIVELSNFAFCLSVAIEFLAFAQLVIRKGDYSIPRKIVYAIMLIAPMSIIIVVLLLASYATYIYGACLTAFGILLVVAKRRDLSCCSFCRRAPIIDDPSIDLPTGNLQE